LDVWVVLRRYVPVGRGVEGVELIKVEARKPRPRRGGDGVPVVYWRRAKVETHHVQCFLCVLRASAARVGVCGVCVFRSFE